MEAMRPDNLPPPNLVESGEQLKALAEMLQKQARVAVDTESNSLHAYQEQVCLIQFSTGNADFLVDPLLVRDLSALEPIFSDPRIEKVFHAAEYDIGCLRRDFQFQVTNLFDTRIAMRTLGEARTGLGAILETEFGVKANKRMQRANWGSRPLSPEQLNYARLDTRFLLPLRDRLEQALLAAEMLEQAREYFEFTTHTTALAPAYDPEGFWRISGAKRLRPQQAAVLRELYLFREKTARSMNRPSFMVVHDKVLLEIAKALPQDLAALGEVAGMTAGKMKRHASQLLAALASGLAAAPLRPPDNDRPNEAVLKCYERLHTWRKTTAQKQKVESDLILPREVMWQIAIAMPGNLDDLRPLMGNLTWRLNSYGEQILRVVAGLKEE